MLERDLARDFTEIFREYQLWVPNNRTAGWPDRGVQINNSKIVWFELKLLTERLHTPTILVNTLAAEQAAWLSKWQMKGGHCFLFLGFVDQYSRNLVKYGIVRCGHWSLWLKVPRQQLALTQIKLFDDRMDVLYWFKDTFVPQAKQGRPSNVNVTTPNDISLGA